MVLPQAWRRREGGGDADCAVSGSRLADTIITVVLSVGVYDGRRPWGFSRALGNYAVFIEDRADVVPWTGEVCGSVDADVFSDAVGVVYTSDFDDGRVVDGEVGSMRRCEGGFIAPRV